MKDVLSNKHYCYKINTSIQQCLPPFYRQPIYMDYLPFLQENLDSLFYVFSTIPTFPINKGTL